MSEQPLYPYAVIRDTQTIDGECCGLVVSYHRFPRTAWRSARKLQRKIKQRYGRSSYLLLSVIKVRGGTNITATGIRIEEPRSNQP